MLGTAPIASDVPAVEGEAQRDLTRPGVRRIAGTCDVPNAPDRIAIRRGDAVEVWSLADQRRVAYAVPGAIASAFTGDRADQLVVATPRALYVERAGRLRRIAANDDELRWRAAVEPVVHRVCSRCRHPGGDGRVDLSTVAAWHVERGELIRRVVDTRTMPPAGTELEDADRRALAGWLLGHPAK
jgi:hypothetical protein